MERANARPDSIHESHRTWGAGPGAMGERCGSVVHGVAARPVLGVADGLGLVDLPQLGHVVGQGVVGVGGRQQRLDGQQHGADLQRGAPLVLEDVQADAAQPVDVRVVDLGDEAHLGRGHGVVLGQEQLQFEEAALEGRVLGPGHDHVEVPGVGLGGYGADARHRLLHQPLRLLDDAPRQRGHG